jgi:hypothetical protein
LQLAKKWVVELRRGSQAGWLSDMTTFFIALDYKDKGVGHFDTATSAFVAVAEYIREYNVSAMSYQVREVVV